MIGLRPPGRSPAGRAILVATVVIGWPAAPRAEPAADERPAETAEPAGPHRWWNGFYARAGGALVKPVTSSRELTLADVNGPASLAIMNGPIPGSGATVDSATIPAGIVGWVLPTDSRRWSLELVLGTPFSVTFEATGTLASSSIAPTALGIPTGIGPLGRQLGEATAYPIVVSVPYQLTTGGVLHPYVGAGASVLFAANPKVTNPTLIAVGHPRLTISPAPGLVLQAGLDALLWKPRSLPVIKSVYARLDLKFILLRAHAEVHDLEVETPGIPLFERVQVGTAKLDLWVNPLIVLAGIGVDL